jgi:hypothetical protein
MTLHAGIESDFSGWSGGYGSGSDGSDSSSSQAVEGDLGFSVFSAIDKVESGQPLSSRDVAVLEGAGLGGMVSDGGDPTRSALYSNYGYGAGLSGGATETFDRVLSATGDTNRAFAAMGALQEAEKGSGTFRGGWVYHPNGTATSLATGLTFWQQHLKTIPGVQVINGVQTTIANRAGKQPIASDIAVAYQREAEAARVAKEAREQEEARQAEIARQAEARRQEEARAAEEARLAEEARVAEAARQAEEARLAEARRAEEEFAAAEERAAQEREAARQAEVERQAEAARQAERQSIDGNSVAIKAYDDAISAGYTHQEAMNLAFAEKEAFERVSGSELSGGIPGQVEQPVFEDVTQPSGGALPTVDTGVEEPLGPPPEGFTGPPDDRTGAPPEGFTGPPEYLSEEAANTPARETGWQVDEQGRTYYVDDRGVRMSPAGVALDPEEERWGSTPAREPGTLPTSLPQQGSSMQDLAEKERQEYFEEGANRPIGGTPGWELDPFAREGDPGFVGPVQTSGGALPSDAAGTASGALPGALPGDLTTTAPGSLGTEIFEALDAISKGQALSQNLSFLMERGYGATEGINPNNPTQSVAEMYNAARLSDFLDRNMPTIIGMTMGPAAQVLTEAAFAMKKGYQPSSVIGMIVSSIIGSAIGMATGVRVPGEAVQDLAQGNVGKAAFGVGVANVAARLGVPAATINSVLRGDIGSAAANQILSEVVNESAKQMGADPGLIATVAVRSGLGQSAFDKIAGAINDNSIVKSINDILGDWSSRLQGVTADVPVGQATEGGALPGGSDAYTSDGGSDQSGALLEAVSSGRPKKRIPRWSDYFLGNLASDLGRAFATTPPPAGLPQDDLDQSLAIADAYNDPSRQLDVINPGEELGSDSADVIANQFLDPGFNWNTFNYPEASRTMSDEEFDVLNYQLDQVRDTPEFKRWFVQTYLPQLASEGVPGIYRTHDGKTIHISGDEKIYTWGPDGESIGVTSARQISPTDTSPDAVMKIIQDLDLERAAGIGTEAQDRMSEADYRALFGTGQSANPPTTGAGQAVFGDVSGTFGSKADALAAFPGLSLVSKDTGTGDETYQNQGFTIIAKADGSVTATPKDQPTMIVELVAPTTVAPPPPPPTVKPEDLVTPPVGVAQDETAASSTTPIQADTDTAVDSAPTTPTGGTTTDVTDTTQGGGATGTTAGGTATTGTTVGGTTGGGTPSGGTQTGTTVGGDTSEVGQEADLGVTQPTPDTGVGSGSGEAGTGQYLTRADLDQILAGREIPPGLSEQDVINAVTKYMTENPGVSITDVSNEMSRQLSDYAKKSDFEEAISKIQFPPGLTPADVTGAITDYMTKNPGLSPNDVSGIVNDAIGKLPVYATPGDVTGAINTALSGYATSGEVGAIGQDVKGLGTQLGEMQAAQEAEKEAEKERVRLQLQQQAQGQMLSTASGFQSKPSGVVDQYKASFLDPFIVGGEAPEFKSPLAGFTQSAITGGFLPSAPSQKRVDATSEDPEYFRAAEIAGITPPLQIYDPTQEFKGLFGFRQGGLVPLMAKGGTRYGENAHGALRVLEHSGKHRVDYRQGDAVTGIGDGQSDDIPAMLADGEFVIPADVVAALGNGSTKAGSDKLYDMMHSIRRHHRSAGPKDLPPPAKSPLEYIKPRRRAK